MIIHCNKNITLCWYMYSKSGANAILFHLTSADLTQLGKNETNDDSVSQFALAVDKILSKIK